MNDLQATYFFSLNSKDLHDPEVALQTSRCHGGVLAMWKRAYDPFINVVPVRSSAFLPIVFSPPHSQCTIHIGIYLPTAGLDPEFIEELAELETCLSELYENYPGCPIYLRGDFNASDTNVKRADLLEFFCTTHNLVSVDISHPTYHHFVGNGSFDSNLDRLFHSRMVSSPEIMENLYCKLDHPLVNSHHDVIISSVSIPNNCHKLPNDPENVTAPVVENRRIKIKWTDEGITKYQELVTSRLQLIQQVYLSTNDKLSPTNLSLCLQSTNRVLVETATATNRYINLGSPLKHRSPRIPYHIRKSQKQLLRSYKNLTCFNGAADKLEDLVEKHKDCKTRYRVLLRKQSAIDSIRRDSPLFSILGKENTNIFGAIKANKRGVARKINKLVVKQRTYTNESVHNGFYDSLIGLKTFDRENVLDPQSFARYKTDFENILKLCSDGPEVPDISLKAATDILKRIRPHVNDLYSTTASHYINAGDIGLLHFYSLLSALIKDVRNTTIEEVNVVHAVILFKGHKKDKTLASSYRTISACPLVAKGLDIYLRDLNIDLWNSDQAPTQYLGEGSSHELAALLLTEVSKFSLHVLQQPLFILYLDAKSAFDKVLRQLLIRNLYFCGTTGKELLHINNRLENRKTMAEWDKVLMGPIADQQGVEQGGVNSGDFYKIYSKSQLQMAQDSKLGVQLSRDITVSAIGQADDTALVSNNLHSLQNLLELSLYYCQKYNVELCSDKTVMQAMSTRAMSKHVEYLKRYSPVNLQGSQIKFRNNAEHVGIVRSVHGNLPNILQRISAHKAAIGAVLANGLAKHHRANQAARLRVEKIYGTPVLLSGLAALVLKKTEQAVIGSHHRRTLTNLLGLLPSTPHPVIYFLSGSLPGEALLHLRQLSLLGMISRLQGSTIHSHAMNVFTSKGNSWSWFHQVRDVCLMYQLPHPLTILTTPSTKQTFKTLVKKHVLNYWELKLRMMAIPLSSLKFFQPSYMSLTKPHPLFTTAGPSPYEVAKARVQALLLSGRYRTESLCSKWSSNPGGYCCTPRCEGREIKEDIEHILLHCSSLAVTRTRLASFTIKYSLSVPLLSETLLSLTQPNHTLFCQFLLDCSVIPQVIELSQRHGQIVLHHLFKVTRTWCYSLHRDRLRLLGRWNPF